MLGNYRPAILKAGLMLRALEEHRENLDLLLGMQTFLVQKITQAERKIASHKQKISKLRSSLKKDRLDKESSKKVKKQIDFFEERIEQYKYLLFVWRCFGDGIAFTYLDKYALKHTLYNSHNYEAKEHAGSLSGKDGLKNEWAFVEMFKDKGFPSMLCDITNTIRHGDVCGLVGPDPFPIEIKSSKNSNKRVQRQIDNLKALHNFYEKDEAVNFRGQPFTARSELTQPEVTYIDELNKCIEKSFGSGIATVSPEEGLHYIVVSKKLDAKVLGSVVTAHSTICLLNETKMAQAWMPYYPFTLSIRNPQHLYKFIRGEFSIIVVIDREVMIRLFKEGGIDATFIYDDDYAIQMQDSGTSIEQGASRTSNQLFGRIPFEFQSLKWFVSQQIDNHNMIISTLAEQTKQIADGTLRPEELWLRPIPDDWFLNDDTSQADLFFVKKPS